MYASINQSREIREKNVCLYFKSDTERPVEIFRGRHPWMLPLIYTLRGRTSCGCIFSAVECVLLIFQRGGWVECFLGVCTLSLLLYLFTCLAYLLFVFSLPCKSFWELYGEKTIPVQAISFTNKSLSSFHTGSVWGFIPLHPFSLTSWKFPKDNACLNKFQGHVFYCFFPQVYHTCP